MFSSCIQLLSSLQTMLNWSSLLQVRMDTDKATEDSKTALEKIRKRFFDDILFPKLIVKGIRSGSIKQNFPH